MKTLIVLGLAAVALSACDATGAFKNPTEMTMQERCDNARLMLALASSQKVSQDTLERVQAGVDTLCPVVPLSELAASIEAE